MVRWKTSRRPLAAAEKRDGPARSRADATGWGMRRRGERGRKGHRVNRPLPFPKPSSYLFAAEPPTTVARNNVDTNTSSDVIGSIARHRSRTTRSLLMQCRGGSCLCRGGLLLLLLLLPSPIPPLETVSHRR